MLHGWQKGYQAPLRPVPMQFVNQAKQSIKVAETVFKNESPKSQDHQLLMKVGELKMAIANFGWINDQNVFNRLFTFPAGCQQPLDISIIVNIHFLPSKLAGS